MSIHVYVCQSFSFLWKKYLEFCFLLHHRLNSSLICSEVNLNISVNIFKLQVNHLYFKIMEVV